MPAEAIEKAPSVFESFNASLGAHMENMSNAFSDAITYVFKRPLSFIFDPINNFFNAHYLPWASLFSIGLFVAGIVWVFTLKKDYVNLDAPGKGILYDLRLWTVVSMTPHIIVYLYFARWS